MLAESIKKFFVTTAKLVYSYSRKNEPPIKTRVYKKIHGKLKLSRSLERIDFRIMLLMWLTNPQTLVRKLASYRLFLWFSPGFPSIHAKHQHDKVRGVHNNSVVNY